MKRRLLSLILILAFLVPMFSFAAYGSQPVQPTQFELFSAAGRVKQISTGGWHSFALMENGTLWAWGVNFTGQLGIKTSGYGSLSNIPAQVTGLTNIKSVAAGQNHSLALKKDGTVWVWGGNNLGQLGNGTTGGNSNIPAQVAGLANVKDISTKGHNSLALMENGTVWTWGQGLGLGGINNIPIQITGLTDVKAIAEGHDHSLVLKEDGTVWAWGLNENGQLGNGTIGSNSYSDIPVQTIGLIDVKAIAAGDCHSLALKEDGTVWAWGHNFAGQLGIETSGPFDCRNIPVQITDLTDVKTIATGMYNSLALKEDGTVWTWGANENGQLGNGTSGSNSHSDIPVQAIGITNVKAIEGGEQHSLALRESGDIWAWGNNWYGQIGDDTYISKKIPVPVMNKDMIRQERSKNKELFYYAPNIMDTNLAVRCAEYSMLAYQEFHYNINLNNLNFAKNKKNEKLKRPPGLEYMLKKEEFNNIENKFEKTKTYDYEPSEYRDDVDDNVSFTLTNKKVSRGADERDLIVVIIRGTDDVEWQGNMDITGDEYNGNERNHWSFNKAKDDVKQNLGVYINKYRHLRESNNSPLVLITGHSRGAAVANLLAHDLNNDPDFGEENVFAYTFATPNNTLDPIAHDNIFNFCFEDDFATKFPLNAGWGYKKHGIMYTATADHLYSNNKKFQNNFDNFLWRSNKTFWGRYSDYAGKANFNNKRTQEVLRHVEKNWKTTKDYYQKKQLRFIISPLPYSYSILGLGPSQTLYNYLRNTVATAAMEKPIGMVGVVASRVLEIGILRDISRYFFDGSGIFWDYLDNTHGPYTYYEAMENNLFKKETAASPSFSRAAINIQAPENPNADELQKLENFANTDDNLQNLGWDLNDLSTWDGIQWTDDEIENRVHSIDISYKELFGELDLSGFSELKSLDISGNLITALDITGCDSLIDMDVSHNYLTELTLPESVETLRCRFNILSSLDVSEAVNLRELYCSSNGITELDITSNILLTELYCDDNELTDLDLSENADLALIRCEENRLNIQEGSTFHTQLYEIIERPGTMVNYFPQKMPENPVMNSGDIAALTAFANQDSNLTKLDWDLSKPEEWYGVLWTQANDEYHVLGIDIDEKELTGDLNVSGMEQLTHLSASFNNLSSIDVSGCEQLRYLSCYDTGISSLNISNCPELSVLSCGNNYLDISEIIDDLNAAQEKDNSNVTYTPQKISAHKNMFNQTEYNILSEFANISDNLSLLEWDINKPGDWSGITWELISGKYRVKELDFQSEKVTGKIDLSDFAYLEKINFAMTDIKSIILTGSLNEIEPDTFYDCNFLESVTIPDGITKIGKNAFFSCDSLKKVILGDTVTEIETQAFINCTSLETIIFPESITQIGYNAFYGCSELKKATFLGDAPNEFEDVFEGADKIKVYYFKNSVGFTTPFWKGYPSKEILMLNGDISAGDQHSLELRTDGTIWSWGYNYSSQLGNGPYYGNGNNFMNPTPKQIMVERNNSYIKFTAVSAGNRHSLALDIGGTVWVWGDNVAGYLGVEYSYGNMYVHTPQQVHFRDSGNNFINVTIVAIAAGYDFSLALDSSGNVWSWGNNSSGQSGFGNNITRYTPTQIESLSGITAISAGNNHALALDEYGNVWSWGNNSSGQLGDGTSVTSNAPVQVNNISGITAISAGSYHSMAADYNGNVWSWGSNSYGQLGTGNTTSSNVPIEAQDISNIVAVSAGNYHSLAIDDDGNAWTWGNNQTTPAQIEGLENVTSISAGSYHSLALSGDAAFAWGNNYNGQLGTGDVNNRQTPTQITNLPPEEPYVPGEFANPTTIAAGAGHSLELRKEEGEDYGTVWSWGANDRRQLGQGEDDYYGETPALVNISSDIVSVAAGDEHSLALDTEGNVWAWGSNSYGQVGVGIESSSALPYLPWPARVLNGSRTVAIAAGGHHSLALKADGTLWAWGLQESGQLGTLNGTNRSNPNLVQTPDGVTFTAIAAGEYYSMAIDDAGNIWAWGSNENGQLGICCGDLYVPFPVQVTGNSAYENCDPACENEGITDVEFTSVSAGVGFSLALDSEGNIWSWGSNEFSRLGICCADSDAESIVSTPVQITGYIDKENCRESCDFHDESCDDYCEEHCWGYYCETHCNNNGIMGVEFVSVDVGLEHALALDSNGNIWAWGGNYFGQLGMCYLETPPITIPTQITGDIENIYCEKYCYNCDEFRVDCEEDCGSKCNEYCEPICYDHCKIGETVDMVFTAIAAGAYHSLAVSEEDGVSTGWIWGLNAEPTPMKTQDLIEE